MSSPARSETTLPADTPAIYPKYKYIALLFFSLISFCNGLLWTTYMPITEYTCQIANLTHLQVYMIGLTYMFLYPVGGFIANYYHDKMGLRVGVNIGGALTLLGGAVRCLAFWGYAPMFIGQSISAIAQPFLINPTSKIVNEWFEPKVRSTFITISACSSLVGNSIGFLIPPIFVNEEHITMSALTLLLISEEAFCLFIGIFHFIFFKNSPFARAKTSKCCNCMPYKQLLCDKSYMLIAVSSALTVGTFGAFNTVVESLMIPFGFTSANASIIGFVLIFGGSVESFVLGWVSDKTKKYKLLYLGSMILLLAIFIIFYFVLGSGLFYLVIIATALTGPGLVYITPLAMDYLARITPDVDESISGGIMQIMVQIITIIETTVCDQIRLDHPGTQYVMYALIMLIVVTVMAIVLGIFMKPLKFDSAPPISPQLSERKRIADNTDIASPNVPVFEDTTSKQVYHRKVTDDMNVHSATSILNKTAAQSQVNINKDEKI